jgi:hypothetical protein
MPIVNMVQRTHSFTLQLRRTHFNCVVQTAPSILHLKISRVCVTPHNLQPTKPLEAVGNLLGKKWVTRIHIL